MRLVRVLQIRRASDVPALMQEIQECVEQGYYLAGYFGYECGYAIPKLARTDYEQDDYPLAWFGVYRRPTIFDLKRSGAPQQ
ncbi:MAG: hypothetical protein MI924_15395 [Chloroflexales bacterium]|nr:hypothetical protein [Chloroflexales bacterium]